VSPSSVCYYPVQEESLRSVQPSSEQFYHILKYLPFQNFVCVGTDQEVQSVISNSEKNEGQGTL
jgi:hypothetical protein